MKAQLEILKRTTFNSDIKVNMNKFYVEDVDRKTEYDDDEEHFIWVKNTYNDQKTEKKTTYNKEKDLFRAKEIEKLKETFVIDKNRQLRELREKINRAYTNWFTKRREKEERKEEIKRSRKAKKEYLQTLKDTEKLVKRDIGRVEIELDDDDED